MIADLPVNYTIGATTYTGAVNEISKGQDAGEGGFLDDFDLTLIGKKGKTIQACRPSVPR